MSFSLGKSFLLIIADISAQNVLKTICLLLALRVEHKMKRSEVVNNTLVFFLKFYRKKNLMTNKIIRGMVIFFGTYTVRNKFLYVYREKEKRISTTFQNICFCEYSQKAFTGLEVSLP